MARLKSRNTQIPNSLRFRIPELNNWEPTPWSSFDSIVRQVQSVRQKNAWMAQQKGWSLDLNVIADEVDIYNAKLCEDHGWTQYLALPMGAAPPPKSPALLQQEQNAISAAAGQIRKIWSGIKTLDEWIDSGEPAVSQELSNKRASVCAVCPKNTAGDLTSWFTRPAASAIKKQIERLHDRKLFTDYDATLNICGVCACPNKLKVQTPAQFIKAHMIPEVLEALKAVPNCWIPKELTET